MDIDDDTDVALTAFVAWFKANGGYIDLESLCFQTFPTSEGGRGMAVVRDIQEGHTLFSVPRHLTLSTGTCLLPSLFGAENWKKMSLNKGWAGLILCMMWEQAKEKSSKWFDYLAILPDHFDTPMFWDENDLYELKGTAVVEKLGREEANQEYNAKFLPALQSRVDLFPPETWAKYYSLEMFHIMGSCILSRSFNVEPWNVDAKNDDDDSEEDGVVDSPHNSDLPEESDDDGEDLACIAMVPMADMLNARFGTENSKLFYEENCLKMVTTGPIRSGEQIWNTYGDLPNSELLRRYGHIDLIPLPEGAVGNPGDVVEIRADTVVNAILLHRSTFSSAQLRERIDWWLDQGGDDVIVIESDCDVPAILLSLIRLFLLSTTEWEIVKSKSKPPKAKPELDVLQVLFATLHLRLKDYPTDLKEDELLMQQATTQNRRNAIVVRMGEKRILSKTLEKLQDISAGGKNKRKRLDDDGAERDKRGGRK